VLRGTAVASPAPITAIGLLPAPSIFGGFVAGPVQAPTFAIPVSGANELFALTGGNRGNGATSEDSVLSLVGANRANSSTTSDSAEVP